MVICGRCGRVVHCVLVVHRVVFILTVAGRVGVVKAVRDVLHIRGIGVCDLQCSALAPSSRAGDKRECESKDHDVANNATH
jgi:hypothetical protein